MSRMRFATQPGLSLPVVDERSDHEAVELLVEGARHELLHRIDRNPHRLALVGGQAGDRLHVLGGRRRKADRDLVDDLRVEDLLDVLDGSRGSGRVTTWSVSPGADR